MMKAYVLDSDDFSNLAEFYSAIGDLLLPGEVWGKNLDALNDVLSGGFNIPESPFELVWKNIKKAQIDLGFEETLRWYESKFSLQKDDRAYIKEKIVELSHHGETLYNFIYDIFYENSQEILIGINYVTFKM